MADNSTKWLDEAEDVSWLDDAEEVSAPAPDAFEVVKEQLPPEVDPKALAARFAAEATPFGVSIPAAALVQSKVEGVPFEQAMERQQELVNKPQPTGPDILARAGGAVTGTLATAGLGTAPGIVGKAIKAGTGALGAALGEAGRSQLEGASGEETALRVGAALGGGAAVAGAGKVAGLLSDTAKAASLRSFRDKMLKLVDRNFDPETARFMKAIGDDELLSEMSSRGIDPNQFLKDVQDSPEIARKTVIDVMKDISDRAGESATMAKLPFKEKASEITQEKVFSGIEEARRRQDLARQQLAQKQQTFSEETQLGERAISQAQKKMDLTIAGKRAARKYQENKKLANMFEREAKAAAAQDQVKAAEIVNARVRPLIGELQAEAKNLDAQAMKKIAASGEPNFFGENELLKFRTEVEPIKQQMNILRRQGTANEIGIAQDVVAGPADASLEGAINLVEGKVFGAATLPEAYTNLYNARKSLTALYGRTQDPAQKWALKQTMNALDELFYDPRVMRIGGDDMRLSKSMYREAFRKEAVADFLTGSRGPEGETMFSPGKFEAKAKQSPDVVGLTEELRTGSRPLSEEEGKLVTEAARKAGGPVQLPKEMVDATEASRREAIRLSDEATSTRQGDINLRDMQAKLRSKKGQEQLAATERQLSNKDLELARKAETDLAMLQANQKIENIDRIVEKFSVGEALTEAERSNLKLAGLTDTEIDAFRKVKQAQQTRAGVGSELKAIDELDFLPESVKPGSAKELQQKLMVKEKWGQAIDNILSDTSEKSVSDPRLWGRLASIAGVGGAALARFPMVGTSVVREVLAAVRKQDPKAVVRTLATVSRDAEEIANRTGTPIADVLTKLLSDNNLIRQWAARGAASQVTETQQ